MNFFLVNFAFQIIIILLSTAVVILNWNGRNYLEKFLPALLTHTKDASIFVADNASEDDSVFFLENNFPEVNIIKNAQNYGFAGGYNEALKKIHTKYYVLLNSDIEVTDNWLAPIISELEKDEKIVACQPKILDYNKKNYFEYAGASGGYIDFLGFPFCRGRIFNHTEEDKNQYDDVAEVFWATGACLIIRSNIFWELGGLDSDFFAHMEEIDFCWRLHNNGYKVVVIPQSKVYHVGGGTLPKKSSQKTYLNYRNNYLLLYKNLPKKSVMYILTIRLFLDWIAALKFFMEGNFKDAFAVFKAQLHTYFSFRKHKHKRSKNIFFSKKHIYKKSIVFDYFIVKKKTFSQIVNNL